MTDNVTPEDSQVEPEDQAFSDAFKDAVDEIDEANAKADQEVLPEEDSESDEAEQEPVEDDPLARLAEVERERDKYRHQLRSDEGRINAYQRQIKELSDKVQQSVASGSTQAEAQEELAQKVNNSSWDELKDDFPEIADALEARMDSYDKRFEEMLGQRIGTLEQQIQPITQKISNDALQSEYAALEAAHPDYQDIASSAEFDQWLDSKPEPVKQLRHSNSAADAAYLLDTYKQDTGQQTEPTSSNKQRNQAKLASNVAVPSRRVAKREVADDDFSAAFEAAVRNS